MTDAPTERLGKRVCRWCRREYRAPVGSWRDGCPDCAPMLELERRDAAGGTRGARSGSSMDGGRRS